MAAIIYDKLEKITKISQDSASPGWDLNSGILEKKGDRLLHVGQCVTRIYAMQVEPTNEERNGRNSSDIRHIRSELTEYLWPRKFVSLSW
jgi:hypothetical protein